MRTNWRNFSRQIGEKGAICRHLDSPSNGKLIFGCSLLAIVCDSPCDDFLVFLVFKEKEFFCVIFA